MSSSGSPASSRTTASRLVRKDGPDHDGYERLACPALGEHPKLCCPLRPSEKGLGKIPVSPPARITAEALL